MTVIQSPQRTDERTAYPGDPVHDRWECGSREFIAPAMRLMHSRRTLDVFLSSLEIEAWEPHEFLHAFRLDQPAHVVIEDDWRAAWTDLGQTLGCVIEQTYEALPDDTKTLINSQMRLMPDE